MKHRSALIALGLVLAMGFAACTVDTEAPPEAEEESEAGAEMDAEAEEALPPPAGEAEEEMEEAEAPEPEAAEGGAESLDATPVDVEFVTSDGVTLAGRYFPAAVNPAPLVVLMHWAPGSQEDWVDFDPPLALILQNRAEGYTSRDVSYAVLTFNYRGYPPSEGNQAFVNGFLDAQAAVAFGKTLEGVDPDRVMTVGASIGADGTLAGCNQPQTPEPDCIAAIPLSPNDLWGWGNDVAGVGDIPIGGVASDGDGVSSQVCSDGETSAVGTYETVVYTGSAHGMEMFNITDQEPVLLDYILGFLDSAVAANS